ncbi:MAG: hypothetical protein WB947_08280 [Thermoplasmata archaeon]
MSRFHHKKATMEEFAGGSPIPYGGPPDESNLGESFHRDVQKARRALFGLSRKGRSSRRASPAAVPSISSADLVARMQAGLKKEHDFVLWPLLDRLESFSNRLARGQDVPITDLEQGLALVDRYLHELHDSHLRLLEMADVNPAKGEAARLALAQLASDYEHARVRWATVRLMMLGYKEKVAGYRSLFSLTLAQECRAERAWHDFEEKYVRTSVARRFTPEVAQTWQTELDRSRDEGRADRARIGEFIGATAAVPAPPA